MIQNENRFTICKLKTNFIFTNFIIKIGDKLSNVGGSNNDISTDEIAGDEITSTDNAGGSNETDDDVDGAVPGDHEEDDRSAGEKSSDRKKMARELVVHTNVDTNPKKILRSKESSQREQKEENKSPYLEDSGDEGQGINNIPANVDDNSDGDNVSKNSYSNENDSDDDSEDDTEEPGQAEGMVQKLLNKAAEGKKSKKGKKSHKQKNKKVSILLIANYKSIFNLLIEK